MDIFDVIGPIMVGPSSSHTAGVVKIGKITNKILGYVPKNVEITFYGSFAETFQGHGSDKAIMSGIMGFETNDERIINSLEIAKEQGISFKIITSSKNTRHPNTVKIIADDVNGVKTEVLAESIGGGNILVRKINQIDVELDGTYNTIITYHNDVPGVVLNVSKILYDHNINISNMRVFCSQEKDSAIMLIDIHHMPKKQVLEQIENIENIRNVQFVPKIG